MRTVLSDGEAGLLALTAVAPKPARRGSRFPDIFRFALSLGLVCLGFPGRLALGGGAGSTAAQEPFRLAEQSDSGEMLLIEHQKVERSLAREETHVYRIPVEAR